MTPDATAALEALRDLIEDVVGVVGASDGDAVRKRTIHARAALALLTQALADQAQEIAARKREGEVLLDECRELRAEGEVLLRASLGRLAAKLASMTTRALEAEATVETMKDGSLTNTRLVWLQEQVAARDERLAALHGGADGHLHLCARVDGAWRCHPGCAAGRAEDAQREVQLSRQQLDAIGAALPTREWSGGVGGWSTADVVRVLRGAADARRAAIEECALVADDEAADADSRAVAYGMDDAAAMQMMAQSCATMAREIAIAIRALLAPPGAGP